MIETKEQYEKIQQKGYAAMVVVTPVEISPLLETIEALRKAIKQAPKIITRPHGTEVCAFCLAHPVDDHYAHCAYNALPDWIKE